MTNFLNYIINFEIPNSFLDNYPIFIHFAGNHKPWTVEGSYENVADIYFSLLNELQVKTYNIKLKSRKAKSLSMRYWDVIITVNSYANL